MAYSNYGAWVFRNGKRKKDRESVPVFSTMPNMSEVVWQRVWQEEASHYVEPGDDFNITPDDIESQEIEIEQDEWHKNIQHAVIGDGDMRIAVYKDFAILYTKGDKVTEKTLVDSSWEGFDGSYYEEPYRIRIKKYHKRRLAVDYPFWKWLPRPYSLFWRSLYLAYIDRMEIWMYNEENNEYWYAYTGMETGSIHHGDKIPRGVRKRAFKYMEV